MRGPLSTLAIIGVGLAASGCGSATPDGSASPAPALQAVIVSSEVVVASNERFPIGILDHNTAVADATVKVRLFYVGASGTQPKGEFDAPFRGDGLNGEGVYVASPSFDAAGQWRADVTAVRPDGAHGTSTLPFAVVASSVVPASGQPAPLTHNQTTADVPDVSYIDSGSPPDDMHSISIADAIAQHKRTLVIFASPAFCTSRICGPEVDVVKSIFARLPGQADVHPRRDLHELQARSVQADARPTGPGLAAAK